jgi:NitT/TauT family transport system substrate-binding protein
MEKAMSTREDLLMVCKLTGNLFTAGLAVVAVTIAMAPAASAADDLSLRLDYLPQGYHAPLFYGMAKGYYTEQGINLKIADGKGSNASLQSVAAGNDTIVLANYATMAQSTTQGMPIIGIGGMIQRLPDALIALKGSGIKAPKDLEGRTGSIPATSAVYKLFPAFALATGIDLRKVKMVQMAAGATHAAVLQGQVDFTTGWAFTQGVQMAKHKPIEPPILMADYGLNLLGVGFVVTRTTATTKGDALKRFMSATAGAYREAIKDLEGAADAMAAARPETERDVVIDQFKLLPPFLHSDRTKGRSFGWMAREDWVQTVDILQKYFELSGAVDIDKVFTNDFVPAQTQ